MIRQLYYPLRLWTAKVSKPVKTIFMVYTNNIFYLYEYAFTDLCNYNSLLLIKFQRYSFARLNITLEDIEQILQKVSIVREPTIPFPQADRFERVINLCELLHHKQLTKEDITVEYGFDSRQTDYYVNAGKYLGFIKEQEGSISLTSTGAAIMSKSPTAKQLAFARVILSHSVFNDVLRRQFATGQSLSKSEIIHIMHQHPLFNLRKTTTFACRASTVCSWTDWVIALTNR